MTVNLLSSDKSGFKTKTKKIKTKQKKWVFKNPAAENGVSDSFPTRLLK